VGIKLAITDFGPCTAIGICDGEWLIAGVVYNWYRQANIEMTIASISPRWCASRILRGLFSYPFEQIGCRRVTAVTEHTDLSVRAFLRRLGFTEEGVMRHSYLNGNDAVIHGMLREECRWIGDKERSV
jgi:RimJ/RimL family protein N-acetyltransferase